MNFKISAIFVFLMHVLRNWHSTLIYSTTSSLVSISLLCPLPQAVHGLRHLAYTACHALDLRILPAVHGLRCLACTT